MHNLSDWVMHMNWADFAFLVVLVYSALTGAWLGFLAECLTVAGVMAGSIVAGIGYNGAGTVLGKLGVPKDARDWAGFVALFVLVSLVFRIFAILARKLSRFMVAGWSNIVTGALLGVLAGGGICLFAVVTVTYFHVGTYESTLQHSKIVSVSGAWLREYVNLLPDKMRPLPTFIK